MVQFSSASFDLTVQDPRTEKVSQEQQELMEATNNITCSNQKRIQKIEYKLKFLKSLIFASPEAFSPLELAKNIRQEMPDNANEQKLIVDMQGSELFEYEKEAERLEMHVLARLDQQRAGHPEQKTKSGLAPHPPSEPKPTVYRKPTTTNSEILSNVAEVVRSSSLALRPATSVVPEKVPSIDSLRKRMISAGHLKRYPKNEKIVVLPPLNEMKQN